MTAPAQAANQQPTPIRQQALQQQSTLRSGGSAPPRLPLLAELSNRIAASIGSATEANSKLRNRFDEILGGEPPRANSSIQAPNSQPPATQALTLLQQCDILTTVLEDLHTQIARLGAI